MKVIFFGTDNFAAHVLEALQSRHEVVAVVTVPDAPIGRKQILTQSTVAEFAAKLGLLTLKPASLKNDLVLESQLRELNADVFIVAVYSKIISQNILDIPPQGNINVHPSLLPLYRGPSPIRTPLLNGDTKTGVTIMLMDEQVDHGPILMSEEVVIEPNDTNVTMTNKLAQIAAPLLLQALQDYESGKIVPEPQNHELATFTRLFKKEDGKIDWTKPAQDIYNQWRALQPWPGIFTTWNGKILKIIECGVWFPPLARGGLGRGRTINNDKPGLVLADGIIVCGPEAPSKVEDANTYLQIHKLQLEGGKVMDIKEFLNGYKNFIDSQLI